MDIFPLTAMGNMNVQWGQCTGTTADTMLALASTMFAFTRCQSPVMLEGVNKWVERPARQVRLLFHS